MSKISRRQSITYCSVTADLYLARRCPRANRIWPCGCNSGSRNHAAGKRGGL